MSNKNSISYRRVGDYNIPNFTLPPEEVNIKLGKWGMLHKGYLEKHNRALFNLLLTQGKLYQHCVDVENQARVMFDIIVEQQKEAEGVTEKLKEKNQFEWLCRIQNIEARAREFIYHELIFKWKKHPCWSIPITSCVLHRHKDYYDKNINMAN